MGCVQEPKDLLAHSFTAWAIATLVLGCISDLKEVKRYSSRTILFVLDQIYLRIEPILCSLEDGGETQGVVQRWISSGIQQNAHSLIPMLLHCTMESRVTINVLDKKQYCYNPTTWLEITNTTTYTVTSTSTSGPIITNVYVSSTNQDPDHARVHVTSCGDAAHMNSIVKECPLLNCNAHMILLETNSLSLASTV